MEKKSTIFFYSAYTLHWYLLGHYNVKYSCILIKVEPVLHYMPDPTVSAQVGTTHGYVLEQT